ncbi:MAG TPA: RNA 2',3'-cyclic phosphodiesterase [Nitrospirota bacterium]|nr:RNA 2',3'-cyclic phosphodiesterase [Nitrospirota bacterium]
MRMFIAIVIPEEIKSTLTDAQRNLKGLGVVDASWPRPEGIHLTLKFLGEVSESNIPDIINGLRHAVEGIGPLRLEVGSIGTFPNQKNARVVWVGLSGEVEKLSCLQAAVEDAMNSIGFERDERAFTPHLTLGRIKYIRSRDKWLKALAEAKDIRPSGFDVGAVSLIKSELNPSGAVYTEISRIELK